MAGYFILHDYLQTSVHYCYNQKMHFCKLLYTNSQGTYRCYRLTADCASATNTLTWTSLCNLDVNSHNSHQFMLQPVNTQAQVLSQLQEYTVIQRQFAAFNRNHHEPQYIYRCVMAHIFTSSHLAVGD